MSHLPFYERIEPYRGMRSSPSSANSPPASGMVIIQALRATTMATVVFFFSFAVMLYTMFFFFIDGPKLGADDDELSAGDGRRQGQHLLDQFVSVTRATLKGTIVIGVMQAYSAACPSGWWGIQGAIFWGTIMTVLSIIPRRRRPAGLDSRRDHPVLG